MEYKIIKKFDKKRQPSLEKDGWKFIRDINDKTVEMGKEDTFKIKELRRLRNKREVLFAAFDILKSNIFFGYKSITNIEKEEIDIWYKKSLDLEEIAINNPPEKVKEYLK